MEPGVGGFQMFDEDGVEADESLAAVKILERETPFELELSRHIGGKKPLPDGRGSYRFLSRDRKGADALVRKLNYTKGSASYRVNASDSSRVRPNNPGGTPPASRQSRVSWPR